MSLDRREADKQKLARMISSATRGSRRRFAHTPMPRPTISQFTEKLAKATAAGGWGIELDDL